MVFCVSPALLKLRRSVPPQFLTAPGPDDAQLREILTEIEKQSLRAGEIIALQRRDIDLDAPSVTVARAASRAGTRWIVKAPKSEAGRRIVPMPGFLVTEVRKHLDTYAGPRRDDWVFPADDGGMRTHAGLIGTERPSLLLLDEVAAHLDPLRREALFDRLRAGSAQVWLTGTELAPFDPIAGEAAIWRVADGAAVRCEAPVPADMRALMKAMREDTAAFNDAQRR